VRAVVDDRGQDLIVEIMEEVHAFRGDAAQRLSFLARTIDERGANDFEAPMRAWALSGPKVAKVVHHTRCG
jgi:hypothetical protein